MYDFISLLPYFPPMTPSLKVEHLLHGLMGKKKDTGGKISYIFPQSDFCALFSVTIKIIGEKIWYYVPYCLHFFSHNFMKHCSCSVFLSLIFSFPLSFLSLSPFLSVRALFSWYFFPIRPYLFPPPGGGGGGVFSNKYTPAKT